MGWFLLMIQLFIGGSVIFRMNNYFGNNFLPQSDAEMICDMLASLMIITLHTAAMLWRSSRKKQS